MKLLARLFSLLLFASLITACGDDDNDVAPEPAIEEASLAFDAQNPPITIPTGLQQTNDQNATLIASQLSTANAFTTSFTYFFQVPESATKSSNPVGRTTNGRTNATNNEVIVYSYRTNFGDTATYDVAYQITDLGSDFLLEYFIKINDGEFFKFIEAKESKDPLRNGYLDIYYSAFSGDEALETAFSFEWSESANGLFEFSYFTETARFDISVNPDNSGNMEWYQRGSLYFMATWNAAGTAGTYAYYDNGTAYDSGNWPS